MIIRSTILQPTSMREAYAAIQILESDYLRAHKRKLSIDLTMSSTSRPVYDERGRPKLSNETIEVRACYDNKVPAQVAEYEWFAARARESVATCY